MLVPKIYESFLEYDNMNENDYVNDNNLLESVAKVFKNEIDDVNEEVQKMEPFETFE